MSVTTIPEKSPASTPIGPRPLHNGVPVTTETTLARDLAASLRARGVAVRTVGEFIDALAVLGIHRDDPLGSIEFGVSQWGQGRVQAERDDEIGWQIWEVSR